MRFVRDPGARDGGAAPHPRLALGVDGRVLDDRYHGIGRITEALLRQFAGDPSLDVTVFTRRAQHSDRFDIEDLLKAGGFRRAEFDLPLTSPLQWFRWPHVLRATGVEATLFPYHLGAAPVGRGRRYSIVHDAILEADPRYAPDQRTLRLYRLLTRVVVRRTHVLTPSRASADELYRYYGVQIAERHIVPWGVAPAFAAVPASECVRGVKLPTSYFLHVGARRPHKNLPLLIRTLALLRPDEGLVLVGGIDERFDDAVPALVRELGVGNRVVHFPYVSDAELSGLYTGAKAFLYPSLVEGFGLPLLEAMAAGVPVVASDIPVFREVSKGAASLVDPRLPNSWATAIRDLDDPGRRAAVIDAGRECARHARWEEAASAMLAALRTV